MDHVDQLIGRARGQMREIAGASKARRCVTCSRGRGEAYSAIPERLLRGVTLSYSAVFLGARIRPALRRRASRDRIARRQQLERPERGVPARLPRSVTLAGVGVQLLLRMQPW